MKVLLDECLPVDFRHAFPTYQVHTVERAGFKGRNNGELLRAAELVLFVNAISAVLDTIEPGQIARIP